LKVSVGSITNIIKKYKCQHQITSQPKSSPKCDDAGISTGTSIDKLGSSSSTAKVHSGEEQTVISINKIPTVTPKSHNSTPDSISVGEPDIDFFDTPYPESYPNIEPNDNVKLDVITQVETAEKERKEFEQSKPRHSLPNSEDTPIPNLGVDWSSEDNWEWILWARIAAEKKQRLVRRLYSYMVNIDRVPLVVGSSLARYHVLMLVQIIY
jgi:hypothetical protein